MLWDYDLWGIPRHSSSGVDFQEGGCSYHLRWFCAAHVGRRLVRFGGRSQRGSNLSCAALFGRYIAGNCWGNHRRWCRTLARVGRSDRNSILLVQYSINSFSQVILWSHRIVCFDVACFLCFLLYCVSLCGLIINETFFTFYCHHRGRKLFLGFI